MNYSGILVKQIYYVDESVLLVVEIHKWLSPKCYNDIHLYVGNEFL